VLCIEDTRPRNSDIVTIARQVGHVRHGAIDARRDRVAVFDLDRTLIPGASIVPFARELAARRLVPRRRLVRAGVEHELYKHRGSSDAQIARVRGQALAMVAGLEREPLLAVADEVSERLAALVGPAARLLLDHHLHGGDFCVLLSSSPQELVERIGRRLGVHRSIGTRAALVDGRYTGGLERPLCYGEGKVQALRLALGEIDLHDSFAYADSTSDLPLLRACGHPVAVNPDRCLRRIARGCGWPVLTLD